MSDIENYFALFQLPTQFDLDINALNLRYRQIQSEVHPDKFVTASPAERLQSMQKATLANEAYQTLKQPTLRAQHLLALQGLTLDETDTSMPADFLMTQMAWRETIEDAKADNDIAALETQLKQMRQAAKQLHVSIAEQISQQDSQALTTLQKLRFIDKVSNDVNDIIAQLED